MRKGCRPATVLKRQEERESFAISRAEMQRVRNEAIDRRGAVLLDSREERFQGIVPSTLGLLRVQMLLEGCAVGCRPLRLARPRVELIHPSPTIARRQRKLCQQECRHKVMPLGSRFREVLTTFADLDELPGKRTYRRRCHARNDSPETCEDSNPLVAILNGVTEFSTTSRAARFARRRRLRAAASGRPRRRVSTSTRQDAGVPPQQWTRDPMQVLQPLAASSQEGGALVLWAVWCADALDYADAIDDEFFGQGNTRGFQPEVIDLAHVRWAAGTASTAIDLCAAALGSWYCGVLAGAHQLDLRKIRPWAHNKNVSATRAKLPPAGRAWVRRTWVDADYKTLLALRNPFTHSRLPRHLTRPTSGHSGRTAFPLPPRPGSSPTIDSRTAVLVARDVARVHVQDFLDEVDARRLGP